MSNQRTTVDAFKGTRADLLALLRDLHNGTRKIDALTRLEAIDLACEVLANPNVDARDALLASRVVGSLARAVGGVS